MKVVFRHYKNVGKTRLRRFIDDACATGQINMYDRPCTPFKDVLRSEHVTVCVYIDEAKDDTDIDFTAAQGYAFCRGDVFSKEHGRWVAENRARGVLSLNPIPNPLKARQEAREGAAAMRHAENRKLGLEVQKLWEKGRKEGWSREKILEEEMFFLNTDPETGIVG